MLNATQSTCHTCSPEEVQWLSKSGARCELTSDQIPPNLLPNSGSLSVFLRLKNSILRVAVKSFYGVKDHAFVDKAVIELPQIFVYPSLVLRLDQKAAGRVSSTVALQQQMLWSIFYVLDTQKDELK